MYSPARSGGTPGYATATPSAAFFCVQVTEPLFSIDIQKVNEAYERLLKSDVKYRFSIDIASLKSE